MELGEKLLQARHEAGLSQRQVCGDEITRNMLSQIEHGTARPSMTTLRFLAARLGKPISYFLEEDAVVSANQQVMSAARSAFDRQEYDAVKEILDDYCGPDEVYDREKNLMLVLSILAQAEQALEQGRRQQALTLLREAEDIPTAYYLPETKARAMRLLSRLRDWDLETVCASLPNLDEDLMLRAKLALKEAAADRAAKLLDAAENQTSPQWNLLRGEAYAAEGSWMKATACLQFAEKSFPGAAAELLEKCYRELGDYKQAYFYACLVRQNTRL